MLPEVERSSRILVPVNRPTLHGTLLQDGGELFAAGMLGEFLEIDYHHRRMPMPRDRLRPLAQGKVDDLAQPVFRLLELPVHEDILARLDRMSMRGGS